VEQVDFLPVLASDARQQLAVEAVPRLIALGARRSAAEARAVAAR
jgi:hypothetical protein